MRPWHSLDLMRRRQLLALGALLALAAVFSWRLGDDRAPRRRNYILISIDTLRADHLGAYGYGRDTSPFFDDLATRGILFERAISQIPGTLPSHMSIFTGLYPAEHQVYPPESILSPAIETLPEAFRRSGYRTGGFTDGGYMDGRYGFARGFETFEDIIADADKSAEYIFGRGAEFLRGLKKGEPFFLFLHTYQVHDPYRPPPGYAARFWSGPPPPAFDPTGQNLSEVNLGLRTITPEAARYFEALYDADIRATDDALRRLFAHLRDLGLLDDTVILITSDHGEEFLEHGKVVHEQIYDECLHVPLLVLAPGAAPRRVRSLVELVDIAPTLYELAGIAPRTRPSGTSLRPRMEGVEDPRREATAEAFAFPARTIYRATRDRLFQLLLFEEPGEANGRWVTREISFDVFDPVLRFASASFHQPRPLEVWIDGRLERTVQLSTAPANLAIAMPAGRSKNTVRLSTPGCVSPRDLGESGDARCLSFLVQGAPLRRASLYELTSDPRETRDLSDLDGVVARSLVTRLDGIRRQPVAAGQKAPLDPELREQLRSLGYIR